jgi:signal transduction histidine kinase
VNETARSRLPHRRRRLINDLLDVASIDAGELAVVPELVDVDGILHDTFEAFEPIAAARHIMIDVEPLQLPLRARLDEGRILQVLANLVSNAVKFTPEEGRILIQVHHEHGEIHFIVRDTGVGIPAGDLEDIFERFHQVRMDRRGLGLGLYISKGIVEAQGGRIWAEGEAGAGSTLHFVLRAA